jgi:histidyl-tRNA synthetase
MRVAEQLRDASPAILAELNLGGGSFKAQIKRADRSGAQYALILGDNEVAEKCAGLKPLRHGEDQLNVPLEQLSTVLGERLGRGAAVSLQANSFKRQ